MAVEYDVIVVGATPAGVQAAIAAVTLKARVALITQGITPAHAPESMPHYALVQAWQRRSPDFPGADVPPIDWERVTDWLAIVQEQVATLRTEAVLAVQGIDVIAGCAEFARTPHLCLRVGDRRLTARGYLLTPAALPWEPAIAGLERIGYLSPADLPTQSPRLGGQPVAVLGQGITAVEVAQSLHRSGCQPILITPEADLLPLADRPLVRLLQAQLDIDGIPVWRAAAISQVRRLGAMVQILSDRPPLTVAAIVLATGHLPDLTPLNLGKVGVRGAERVSVDPGHLIKTAQFQTSQRRIYLCEGRRGQECFTHLAQAEAAIALRHILFGQRSRLDPLTIPLTTHTEPALAWVGQTEAQAIAAYGKRAVFCLSQPGFASAAAHLPTDRSCHTTWIVHRHGRILGAQCAGTHAHSAIALATLALQQRLSIGAIAHLPLPHLSPMSNLPQTAAQFRRRYFQRHPVQLDWLDHWFDWCRLWTRS